MSGIVNKMFMLKTDATQVLITNSDIKMGKYIFLFSIIIPHYSDPQPDDGMNFDNHKLHTCKEYLLHNDFPTCV